MSIARWHMLVLLVISSLCLASRCNGSRWTNPETGIPPHPGGAPTVGYIAPTPVTEVGADGGAVSSADSDADADAADDSDTTEASPPGAAHPDQNPY